MLPLNQINVYKNEITNLILELNSLDKEKDIKEANYKKISEKKIIISQKVNDLLPNTQLGYLDNDFIRLLKSNRKFLRDQQVNLKLYSKLVKTTHLTFGSREKNEALKKLEIEIKKFNSDVIMRRLVLLLVKSVYTSKDIDIINLFYKLLPRPPLSLFDKDNLPPKLIEFESQRNLAFEKFKDENKDYKELSQKITYLQRQMRGKLRYDSEIDRLAHRYFEYDVNKPDQKNESENQAKKMIENANTPYTPQQCRPELSKRIMETASKIKLYNSITHFLAASNMDKILDGCLFGRKNLQNLYISYRRAALTSEDVKNGDGSVICMGPDKVDPRCFVERTVGLEFDLKILTQEGRFKKNPTMFFKQMDLGFDPGWQTIRINQEMLCFSCTESLNQVNDYNQYLKLSSHMPYSNIGSDYDYLSGVPKDLFISYNIEEMDQILILNFFRWLDHLQTSSKKEAKEKIKEIYDFLDSLNDEELCLFLTDLGKKISCSAEFNFFGAYKIDLNALISLSLYQGKTLEKVIKIADLCDQLNSGNFDHLNVLKKGNPEIFKSIEFVNFLTSKISNEAAKSMLKEIQTTTY